MTQNTKSEILGSIGHLKKQGKGKIILIGLLLGVLLLIIGSTGIFGKQEEKITDEKSEIEDYFEYKSALEEEILAICRSVDGISNVEVVVYFDSTGGSIYAQNTQSGGVSDRNEYVIIGSGSSAHALYIGESLPNLSGIGIVCSVGDNDNRANELCALLSKTYGLPLTRVYVVANK